MLAIGLSSYGGPQVLHMVELPDPHPVPGQVRVKVRAAGVNPVDIMVRNGSLAGLFARTKPPFVPGMDIAGTIDEVGEDIPPNLASPSVSMWLAWWTTSAVTAVTANTFVCPRLRLCRFQLVRRFRLLHRS
ncbi:alcohol dehydrogenase catalytic domain-containing protein [Burkholderia anthina]|uniref:alcohol dehydrogenase catalytic domain-containing protein n=1 Tax=Burkholderia anthina TaxID=179879 RepID=UPI001ABBAC69|nr:alcohol dehydrogenase catalytic domain-containing protein [Burkholderia anthina]